MADATKANRLKSSLIMAEEPEKIKVELSQSSLDANVLLDYSERLGLLRIAAEEELQRLKEEIKNIRSSNSLTGLEACSMDVESCSILPQGKIMEKLLKIDGSVDVLKVILASVYIQIDDMSCSLKDSVREQQWEQEFQREISTIILHNFIVSLQGDFETKLCGQRNRIISQKNNLQIVRQELDAISRSLLSSEPGLPFFHSSHENLEDLNSTKGEDNSPPEAIGKSGETGKQMVEIADSPQLKRMTKEGLITYYKTEITEMKRQHESALHEKTEELFSLKREFLKEKGSLPFRKDKDFELLRKKVPKVILLLDDILVENEKLRMFHDDHDKFCKLKDKIDDLFFENQRLQGSLTEKTKEVKSLPSQVSSATNQMSHHSSTELYFQKEIKKLQSDVEDVKIEAAIKDEIQNNVLRDWVGEAKCHIEDLEMETKICHEIYSILLGEFVGVPMSTINPILVKYYEEKDLLEVTLIEKEKALSLRIEENEQLKQEIASLSTLTKEKEKFASEAISTLMQQKEHFDLVCRELDMLRDLVGKQEILISENNSEFGLIKGRLDETLEQIQQYEVEISKLNQELKIASDGLAEAEERNTILHSIIQEKQKTVSSAIAKEEEQTKRMRSIMISVIELSKALIDCERKLRENIERNESRLKILNHQIKPLAQQINLLMKKGLWYKERLDRRCSDFQKAEIEVDLLGNEVDSLMSLLDKIYVALDHYSLVLQHYPGIMEILKLVRRQLKGETSKSA